MVVISADGAARVYQLMRDVRPRVMKYTWLAPPGRTEAKKTWNWKNTQSEKVFGGRARLPTVD